MKNPVFIPEASNVKIWPLSNLILTLNAKKTKPVIVIVTRLKLLANHVSHKHTPRALSYDYIEALRFDSGHSTVAPP